MSMFHELMMKKKGMPSRYQEVEYIESSGTQYIDTGIIPANIPNLKIEFCISDFSSGRFGTQRNNYFGITNWALCPFITNNNSYIQFGGSGTEVIISSTPLQKHNYFVDIENQKIIIDNQTEISTSFSTTNAIDNFFLFADNFNQTANNFASAKVYCFRFYSGSTLIRNFIPVYDTETQKYGMWESVQDKFYGNDGTGDFGGSIVGYTIVGSPTIVDGVVSGFTMSDYLMINGNITDNFSSIEFCVVFTTPNTLSNQPITSSTSAWNNDSLFSLSSGGQNLSFNIKNGVSMACNNYILQPNTKYKGILKRNNGIYTLSLYSGDTTLLDSVSLENSSYLWNGGSSAIIFGKDTPLWNSYFKGSIDIANSYIKINNKLWFNGQQA